MPPRPKLALTLDKKDGDEVAAPGKDAGFAGISGDKFEGRGVVVDKAGVRMTADGEAMAGAVSFEDIEIVKKLGAGCSSVVQLARHKVTGELYALKCINLFDKGVRDMLLTELSTLFKSDCEALIDFHGATYREGQVAVILEFMNLGGLDNVLRKAPGRVIPERVLAGMAYQMLFGLGYLAFERRVHRDIKPQNILANTDGRVKLTDFGISRELSTAVLAKTFIGSFKYMSPERIQHMPYDYASDIWSLGLVLLECASGKYPYPEATAQIAMVMTVTEGEPPLPPRDGGLYTPEFHDFLARCIAKDPRDRASAMDLLESSWMERHEIFSLPDGIERVREWMVEVGFKDEYAALKIPGALPPGVLAASAAAGGGAGSA